MKKQTVTLVLFFLFGPLIQWSSAGAQDPQQEASDSDWPMYGGSPERDSFSASYISMAPGVNWSWKNVGRTSLSSPTIVNDLLYIGGDRYVGAFNVQSGKELWNFTLSRGSIYSTPLIYKGLVFFGVNWGEGYLYALNALNGTLVWKTLIGEMYTTSPLGINNVIYTSTNTNGTYAIHSNNGTIIWRSAQGLSSMHSSVAYHDGVVYAAGGCITALNSTNGSFLWKGEPADSSVLYYNGCVYARRNGIILCINSSNGQTIWKKTVNELSSSAIISSPSAAFGRIFFGTAGDDSGLGRKGQAFAFDSINGEKLWSTTVDAEIYSKPTITANGIVFFATNVGLYGNDCESGKLVFRGSIVDNKRSIALYNNTIYDGEYAHWGAFPNKTTPAIPRSIYYSRSTDIIELKWIPPIHNGGCPITKYRIYRSMSPGCESLIAEIQSTPSYIDRQIDNYHTYYYRIAAVNEIGQGSLSEEIKSARTNEPSQPQSFKITPGIYNITLNWSVPEERGGSAITGYNIYRRSAINGTAVVISSVNKTVFVDSGLKSGTIYYYRITAVNAIGEGNFSDELNATLKPQFPQFRTLTPGGDANSITLYWSVIQEPGGPDIIGYNVYRKNAPNETAVLLSTTTKTSYTDNGLKSNTTYIYQVSIVTSSGEGPRQEVYTKTGVPMSVAPQDNGTNPFNTIFNVDPLVGALIGGSIIITGIAGTVVFLRRSKGKPDLRRMPEHNGSPAISNGASISSPVSSNTGSSDNIELPSLHPIDIQRNWDYIGGSIRVKVAIINRSESILADVRLRSIIDSGSFLLDRVEPSTVQLVAGEILLGNINPREKRTCAIYLDPLICTTSNIEGVVHYRDFSGKLLTENVPPLKVGVACPLFFTPQDANIATVRNLLTASLDKSDGKVYSIPDGLEPQKAFLIAKETIGLHSIRHIKDFVSEQPYSAEGWFYGTTKEMKNQFVILVRVFTMERQLALTVYSESIQNICGLLSELRAQLNEKLMNGKYITKPLRQITNISIRDSIITRSTILLGQSPPLARLPRIDDTDT